MSQFELSQQQQRDRRHRMMSVREWSKNEADTLWRMHSFKFGKLNFYCFSFLDFENSVRKLEGKYNMTHRRRRRRFKIAIKMSNFLQKICLAQMMPRQQVCYIGQKVQILSGELTKLSIAIIYIFNCAITGLFLLIFVLSTINSQ